MTTELPARMWLDCGLAFRGDVRRELAKTGLRVEETKSLLMSTFVIYGTLPEIEAVQRWASAWADA